MDFHPRSRVPWRATMSRRDILRFGAAGAVSAAVLAAYYGSTVSYRLGLDPDTYGIPIITAAVDLLGFMSLIIALIVFGLTG